MSEFEHNPMTCRHPDRRMVYQKDRSACRDCGRTWRAFYVDGKAVAYRTEPAFPTTEPKRKRTSR